MTVNLLGIAGMASKTTVAPLDRVKILLQAKHHQYVHQGMFYYLPILLFYYFTIYNFTICQK